MYKNEFMNEEMEKRQKQVDNALSISLLDAGEPTEETKKLAEDFIAGKISHEEMKKMVIERYKEA